MLPNFTKRQWLTLIVFSIGDFCNAICVSLQAPFYPDEAEKHGASASEYGLVFGVFELVVFIISPIYGKYLNRIGSKLMFNGGIFTVGTSAILFGLLDEVPHTDHLAFISLSFIIRIVEALGNAAFLTASFAIIAQEFPNNIATTFASLETFFGLGLIVGPTVGGALFSVGSYKVPFAVMGSCLFLSAIMTAFVLPEHAEGEVNSKESGSLLQVLKIPGVLVAAASIISTSISIGFLQATLAPHLRDFNLTAVVLGLMFVINGGCYALTAPCWGLLCDKFLQPKIAIIIGCILIIIGFLLVGPAPFIDDKPTLTMCIIGLVAHGFGIAAQLVASFTDALRSAIAGGFPNNLETYGLISGLWTSTFALGAFIGPSIGGILFDTIQFPLAAMFVVALNAIVALIVCIFLCSGRSRQPYKNISEESQLTPADKSVSSLSSNGVSRLSNNGLLIERAPGMKGIIACNSYKNRHGTWHRRESGAVLIGPYSTSYGSLESRGFLESVTRR